MKRSVSRRTVLNGVLGFAGAALGLSQAVRTAAAYEPICADLPGLCDPWTEMANWIDTTVLPIPDGNPAPLRQPGSGSGFWESFREPYPAVPVWNPPGRKRVGIQAGHWKYADSPEELANNRSNPGSSGGGKAEWEVNLDIAERVAALLEAEGYAVDLLDGTPPIRYRAHAFIAIHADGDASGTLRGYKAGSAIFSATPETDKLLVEALWDEYGRATGLTPQPDQVSRRMTGYYAFNAKRYQHAIAPGVPHAIIETAFLTNADDRWHLFNNQPVLAQGIAAGITRFFRDQARRSTTG